MARRVQTRGSCVYCGKDYTCAGMSRHLQSCPARKEAIAYDFGSTTELELQVIGERLGAVEKYASVRILARNKPPEYLCEVCEQNPATRIYVWEDYALLCDECGDESDYNEEGLLPLVNSPRAGVCGYTGEQLVSYR